MIELYRALPQEDVASPRFVIVSNDCQYLGKEVAMLAKGSPDQNDIAKFPDTISKLEVASTRALISSIVLILRILYGAHIAHIASRASKSGASTIC
jgi:centromere/kinetochore protein ZW10